MAYRDYEARAPTGSLRLRVHDVGPAAAADGPRWRARRAWRGLAALFALVGCAAPPGTAPKPVDIVHLAVAKALPGRRLALADFRDRLEGGWVLEMAGYAWGAPTESKYQGRMIPDGDVPAWQPARVNAAFADDNFYAQGPYLSALAEQGPFATIRTFGERFARLDRPLWHANGSAWLNLHAGIPAPASGHYASNPHADDIDWLCCGSGVLGLVTPGQSEAAVDLAFRAGHVVGYGDGVYPGMVAAVMVSAAYFAPSVEQIVATGRLAAPEGTKTRRILDDVIAWHARDPEDWTRTWQHLHEKWESGPQKGHCPDGYVAPAFNIDAWLHLAYDVTGLLYGGGDVEQSMRIAMRAGQDSDCTTPTVGEVLGTWKGLSGIEDRWTAGLDRSTRLAGTSYSYDDVIAHSIDVARAILLARGGQVEAAGSGDETWVLPADEVAAPLREQWPAVANRAPEVQVQVQAGPAREVSFTAFAQDGDGVAAYEWFFGDLFHQQGPTATHRYREAGPYEATLFVSDNTGNATALSVPVTLP